MIELDSMSAIHKRRWLVFAVVIALTAVASFRAFDPEFGVSQHLSFAILPCIGSLALLPSDPGARITSRKRAPPARRKSVRSRRPPSRTTRLISLILIQLRLRN